MSDSRNSRDCSRIQSGTIREQITRDYLGGMSLKEVAAKYGRTPGGVQTSLWSWGVKLPREERARRHREVARSLNNNGRGRKPVWPDCPEHQRADYETLCKYMRKSDARAALEGTA